MGLVLLVNGVTVEVAEDPIETVVRKGGFDALVSSDDTHLSMGAGVSLAIRRAAGQTIEREAKALIPLRIGDVAVTSAGNLPARYVLHAVTLDLQRGIRPSERTLRLAAENVFRRCELLQVGRLAMPALGIGAGQFPAERAATLILSALAEHVTNPSVIRNVVFCLPDTNARLAFVQYLERVHCEASRGLEDLADTAAPQTGDSGCASEIMSVSRRRPISVGAPGAPPIGERLAARLGNWFRVSDRARTGSTTKTDSGRPGGPTRGPAQDEARLDLAASRPLVSNRYVLLEELGRGGMGIVYLAWDIVLRQTVAIKTLRRESRGARDPAEALKREAAVQIGLIHDAIVRVLHFEPWDAEVGPYIIMEYLPWTSGDRWIAEAGLSGLPVRSVLSVGTCLCDALVHAHLANVLHGDIKPSNVFVDSGGDRAKLADFGIARAIGVRHRSALVTQLVGTPNYMAPEQKAIGAKVGPWTDIYLLARTLTEFIGSPISRAGEVQFNDDPSLAPVVDVLRRALAPDPRNRPSDAQEFGSLLGGALASIA